MKNLFSSYRKGRAREEHPISVPVLVSSVPTHWADRPWSLPFSTGDHPSGGKLRRPQQALTFVVTVTVIVGLENSKSLCKVICSLRICLSGPS